MASQTYYAYGNGGSDTKYRGKVILTETNDVANNRSTIAYSFYVWRNDGYTGAVHQFNHGNKVVVTINGAVLISSSNYKAFDLTGTSESKPFLICSGSTVVNHNSDGTKSFSFSFEYDQTQTIANFSYLTISGTHVCTSIPRASQPSIVTFPDTTEQLTIGQTYTVHMNKKANFTHYVYAKWANKTVEIGTNVVDNVDWTIPAHFGDDIPNTTVGTGYVYVDTYNGSNYVGTKFVTFYGNIPSTAKPTISAITAEENVQSIATKFDAFVKNKSMLDVAITAAGSYGSTIAKYTSYIESVEYDGQSFTSNIIGSSGTINIASYVTDSRGRISETFTQAVTIVNYADPIISVFEGERVDASGVVNDEGTNLKLTINFAISPVDNLNDKSYLIQYRISGTQNWTTLTSGSLYSFNDVYTNLNDILSVDNSYEIKIIIEDFFKEISKTISISTAFTLIDYRNSGKGIAFGKVSEKDKFECAIPAEFQATNFLQIPTINGDGFLKTLKGKTLGLRTQIPANADLNNYVTIGSYGCPSNADAATISNCPTTIAFFVDVIDSLGAGIEGITSTWQYILQELTDISGKKWIRPVNSNGTVSDITYGDWIRIGGVDWIVEHGTSDNNWNYIKFNSGLAIVYAMNFGITMPAWSALGSLYWRSIEITIPIITSSIFVSIGDSGADYARWTRCNGNWGSNKVTLQQYSINTNGNSEYTRFQGFVIGTWK